MAVVSAEEEEEVEESTEDVSAAGQPTTGRTNARPIQLGALEGILEGVKVLRP